MALFNDTRFVFVGGCERSGTSLVQKVLAAHSRVVGTPELMFGGRIADLHRRMAWLAKEGPEPYRLRLERYLDGDEIDESFREFFRSLFRNVDLPVSAALVCEKTPSNIFSVVQLLSLFPDSRFIHVIRDGRDVVASHRDVAARLRSVEDVDRSGTVEQFTAGDHSGLDTRRVCRRWNRAIDKHFEILDRSEADRYFVVRLEDLLDDPPQVLQKLTQFLDLDVEEQMLTPEQIDSATTVVDGIWTTAEQARMPFDVRRIGRWRSDLDSARRWAAGVLMARNLKRLAYSTHPAERVLGRLAQPLA